jgi:hypothetical protein
MYDAVNELPAKNIGLTRPFMKNTDAPILLIALDPQDTQIARDIVGEEFQFVICHTFQQAESLLNEDIGLIACGIHFDEGKMFDLLHLVRSTPKVHDVPFLLVLGRGLGYSSSILRGINTAATSLGATAFINMLELVSSMGREEAYEDIRKTVRRVLLMSSLKRSINAHPTPGQSATDGE